MLCTFDFPFSLQLDAVLVLPDIQELRLSRWRSYFLENFHFFTLGPLSPLPLEVASEPDSATAESCELVVVPGTHQFVGKRVDECLAHIHQKTFNWDLDSLSFLLLRLLRIKIRLID
jgi:hypothetical protein